MAQVPRLVSLSGQPKGDYLLLIAIILSYILPFWDGVTPHRESAPAIVSGDTWLSRLNSYRQSAGLTPVDEVDALSVGDANHARYLVANNAEMIRSGKIDASI